MQNEREKSEWQKDGDGYLMLQITALNENKLQID